MWNMSDKHLVIIHMGLLFLNTVTTLIEWSCNKL